MPTLIMLTDSPPGDQPRPLLVHEHRYSWKSNPGSWTFFSEVYAFSSDAWMFDPLDGHTAAEAPYDKVAENLRYGGDIYGGILDCIRSMALQWPSARWFVA